MTENIIHFAALRLSIATVWTLGYLKGRWDAGVSIGKRYEVRKRPSDLPHPFGNKPFVDR